MIAPTPDIAARWLQFAKEDLRIVPILIRENAFNMACFHAQQAAEKALKAVLVHYVGGIPKVHQLSELLQLAIPAMANLKKFETTVLQLDQYYIPTRYPDALPGMGASGMPRETDAAKALELTTELVSAIQNALSSHSKR